MQLVLVGVTQLAIRLNTPSHGGWPNRWIPAFSVTPHTLHRSPDLAHNASAPNYRKVVNASQAFPALLLDALAGYIYLTETLHFEARNILMMGDSAGGHLCLALSRYLSDMSPPLPLPGKMALSSPWSDWTLSFPSHQTNIEYDFLAPGAGKLSVAGALRFYKPEAKLDPYFSPALAGPGESDYLSKADVKVYVQLGTREVLCDEIRAVVNGMERDGVDVQLREVCDMDRKAWNLRLMESTRVDCGWTACRYRHSLAWIERLGDMER